MHPCQFRCMRARRADLVCKTSLAVPKVSEQPELSATESTLFDALENCKITLSRLQATRGEVDRAIEREQAQIQRLTVALEKVRWLSREDGGRRDGREWPQAVQTPLCLPSLAERQERGVLSDPEVHPGAWGHVRGRVAPATTQRDALM